MFQIALALYLVFLSETVNSGTFSDVTTLYNDLTSGHNPHLRPETDQTQPTTISTEFSLVSLLDINEVEGTVIISGYFTISWTDKNLIWDPSKYGNVNKVTFPHDVIWKPPLLITNSATTFKMMGMKDSYIKVTSGGFVYWQPGESIKFTCSIDSTYFPFDTQICKFNMMVWGFDDPYEVRLQTARTTINTESFGDSGEWELVKTNASVSNGIDFEMHFKRRPMFLVISIILPVIFIAFLNIFVFILPQESGERIGFSITALLSIVVFLTIAQELLPATALPRLSAICITLTIDMFMSGCIIISVIISSWLYNRSADKSVSVWIQNIISFQLLCRKNTNNRITSDPETVKNSKGRVFDTEAEVVHEEVGKEPKEITWQKVSAFWDKVSIVFYVAWFTVTLLVFVIDIAKGTTNI